MISGLLKINKNSLIDIQKYQKILLFELESYSNKSKQITWTNENCLLCQSSRENVLNSVVGSTNLESYNDRYYIAVWSRLDNREELAKKLNITSNSLANTTDNRLILLSYLKYKEDCTKYLFGDFCFAIYDKLENVFFCVRDQMGIKPFYYYFNKSMFVFSSSLSTFHKLDIVPMNPDMEWPTKYLANLSMDFRKTAYDKIYKLMPAEQAVYENGKITRKTYFKFHTDKLTYKEDTDYIEAYKEKLNEAVKVRVQSQHPLGSEISGGLDSSTVTAYAALNYNKPLTEMHTFGFAYLEQEPSFILQVNQKYGINNSYICCKKHGFDFSHERTLEILGYPVEHGVSTGHERFYQLGEQYGIRTLLSGFGGDEFVTSIHGDLILYELLKDKDFKQLYYTVAGNRVTKLLRCVKMYLKHFKNPAKKSNNMLNAFNYRWPLNIIADDCSRHYNIKSKYLKIGNFDNGYGDLDKFTLEKRNVPFVSTRTAECTLMANSYGIDYAWPLLDVRLIQQFLSTPSKFKFFNGINRYMHKKAVDGIVPKDVTWKQGKGMGEKVNKSVFAKRALNKDLHHDLKQIINLKKLEEQNLLFTQDEELKNSEFQIRQNIRNVNNLDNWLKYYHPNGCNWKNTPDDK